jgi:phosphatidylglycerophosphate synthase
LLKFVPTWVAPNTITLVAFCIVLVVHFLFLFYDEPTFGHAIAKWKYPMFAVGMFLYQHLDNLDGKQARKTSK